VRQLCDKYDLAYTIGSLGKQYLLAFRTLQKLALPDRFLRRTADDTPRVGKTRYKNSSVTTVDIRFTVR
jgi:NADPH-dependent stearoyl-CoA 9-desaturase